MFLLTCLKIISVLLAIVGVTYAIPLTIALVLGESCAVLPFAIPMIVSIVLMIVINVPTRKIKIHMSIRQTYVIVALSWIFISLMGAIPMYFSGCYKTFTDAFFESVSGFTTTGCTVCNDIDNLPRSINTLRTLTHWLGGMGVVTLTVALLPLLGVGGFQLIKAETTGPEKGKVTARIATTAKVLWIIYAGFTVLETVLLMIAGMDFIDAMCHSFATLGTGGFSTRNASVGGYNSVAIDVIITVFMLLAGINFSLFYYIFIRRISDVVSNTELKVYLSIIVIEIVAVTLCLIPVYGNVGTSLRYSSFQVVSLLTTTGFGTADYLQWPATAQILLFFLFFIGGCSGSTGGGIKVIRWVVLAKQVNNETRRMLHPHGVFSIRIDNRVSSKSLVLNVTSFMILYIVMVAITTFVGCAGNLDAFSAFTGALSMVGNVGPAFGALGPSFNYGFLPSFVKWWYCFAMLAGRLELYTMIIFFLPGYWEK
ncbi:MAG: TrkH family potassium uptake protein [Treponema sp.]|nr:TrkH family potassium uptake protein [Treponema sp.]